MKAVRTCVTLGVVAAACTRPTGAGENGESKVTALAIDLPAGLQVTIDDGEAEAAPIAAREVAAGSYTVKAQSPCGEVEAEAAVTKGATTTVSETDFEGLGFAELTVVATNVDGTPLTPQVLLAGWQTPKEGGRYIVPACTLKLEVASEGLGKFFEEIAFEKGAVYERRIVLAPGPDVARIPGGDFVLGPPQWWVEEEEKRADEYIGDSDDFYPMYVNIPRIPVKVATFDLDRSEITAAQMLACFQAGPCKVHDERYSETAQINWKALRSCNFQRRPDPSLPGEPNGAFAQPGRENYPANCVAQWEAEEYCRWVGKRLPTDVEFEYAARGGNAEFTCPWGRAPDCGHDPKTGLYMVTKPEDEVCTRQNMNSTHGVCDLVGNVQEWVARVDVPGRRNTEKATHAFTGTGVAPFDPAHAQFIWEQDSSIGFRCARDLVSGKAGVR